MPVNVVYNGVTLDQVRINEFRIDNPSSHENPSSGFLKHFISGEALVWNKEASTSTMTLWTQHLTERLNDPRKQCKVEITSPDGTSVLFDTTGVAGDPSDEAHGPFFRANISQITGTNAAIVNFSLEYVSGGESLNGIKSFYCATTFAIDEIGRTTIRKVGSLQIRASTSGSSLAPSARNTNRSPWGSASRTDVVTDFITTNGLGGGLYSDFFRRFVSGNMYPGFRRLRQEYAHDESRTRLLFDITDQEFTRGLPAPARVGDCHFTFERELSGTNAIGIKHFIATVEGDRNVTAGALLTLCIRLSQNRIDYAKDTIVRMRVSEQNMLSKNEITFEVVANATSAQQFNAVGGDGESAGNTTLVDQSLLLKNILSPINLSQGQFQFVPAIQPDEYGTMQIVRVTPGAYACDEIQSTSNIGLASTIRLEDNPNPVVYVFPPGYFDAAEGQTGDEFGNIYVPKGSPAVPAGPNKGDLSKNGTDNQGNPANPNANLSSKGGRRLKVSSNIVLVPGISPDAKPMIFQVGAPVAEVTEFLDGAKMNESPARVFSEKAPGSVVSGLGYSLTSGTPDLNGNRVLSAAYDRTVLVTSPGDFDGSGNSATQPAFRKVAAQFNEQQVDLIVFNPSAADLVLPRDETQGQAAGFTQPNYQASAETYLA